MRASALGRLFDRPPVVIVDGRQHAYQAEDKLRLRPKSGVAAPAKLLTTFRVAAHLASGAALAFDPMLVSPHPAIALLTPA
jgi:hypothetical protein